MAKNVYRRSAKNAGVPDQMYIYDTLTNAQRNSEVGHIIKRILGALNTAVNVGYGVQLRIYNNDSAVHYVAFGDSTVAAPSSPANGIPVPAGQYILLGSGENTHVRSDSNTVFGYEIDPNSKLVVTPES